MAIVKAILLEPIKKLGKPGDIVPVRRGYFRYLEMLNKVRYATKEAILHLEEERENLKLKDEERRTNFVTINVFLQVGAFGKLTDSTKNTIHR